MSGDDSAENLVDLTPEEHFVCHQLLIKMYPDNHKLVYAANMMTVSNSRVCRINNKKYGWLKRKFSTINAKNCTKPIPEKETLIKLYYEDYLNSQSIGNIYNVSGSTVLNWLKRYNLKVRTPGEALSKIHLSPAKKVLIDLYLKRKMSMKEIGSLYNTNKGMVRTWIISQGIKTRPRGGNKKVKVGS
jgi:predicted DNA-binding protein YlxM (UPF0122 family)